MDKKKVLVVFGTRPEAIKMAPLVKELLRHDSIETKVALTAQHREMLDQVMTCFDIKSDYDLNIMRHGQTLADITSAALVGLQNVMEIESPDLVLVHGDTTTTFAGALAAFYKQIPCGHVEAGLRTGDKYAPFPEEINRCLTGVMAEYHFAPTTTAQGNLLKAGVDSGKIVITGNTVIDALLEAVDKPCDLKSHGTKRVNWDKKVVLITCHRRENWGEPMANIFQAIAKLAKEYQGDYEFLYPVHKNPKVLALAEKYLGGIPGVHLIEPLDYLPMAHAMNQSYLVVTDSGGLQEEAPALGKPVLVLRAVTERPEAIAAGTAKLIGNTQQSVYDGIKELLANGEAYEKMAKAVNPYGDGLASKRIVQAILDFWQGKTPTNWQREK